MCCILLKVHTTCYLHVGSPNSVLVDGILVMVICTTDSLPLEVDFRVALAGFHSINKGQFGL